MEKTRILWYDIIVGKGKTMTKWITIADTGEGEFFEKKSKFIGYAKHVETEEDANVFIGEIKAKHWDAKHNVYAYVLGENGNTQRSTDDGEPSGTAGRPILEIIKGENLTNTVIVVTRYFGGILLGTGGLVRAYSKAAKLALENSKKVRPVLMRSIAVCANYDLAGKIENFLIQKEIDIDHIDYLNNVMIYCLIPGSEEKQFSAMLNQQFQADIPCHVMAEEQYRYVPWEDEK